VNTPFNDNVAQDENVTDPLALILDELPVPVEAIEVGVINTIPPNTSAGGADDHPKPNAPAFALVPTRGTSYLT